MLVAITGATGFLGLHLLRNLLDGDDSIVVLARSRKVPALDRITRFLEAVGLPEERVAALGARIEVVTADITQPRLGMTEAAFEELAGRIDVLWHSAANTLSVPPHKINVGGTGAVLELLDAGGARARLNYVGSVAAAGKRPDGVVPEAELDSSFGFGSPYERSKSDAENLVRRWCERTGQGATILRPSVLTSSGPCYPGQPGQTVQAVRDTVSSVFRVATTVRSGTIRVHSPRVGTVNFLPVDLAATAMVRVCAAAHDGVRTVLVVNQIGTPASVITNALGLHFPTRFELVNAETTALSPIEKFFSDAASSFLDWAWRNACFETTELTKAGLAARCAVDIDARYLLECMRSDMSTAPVGV